MTQCTHGTYSRLGRCPAVGTERLTELVDDVTGEFLVRVRWVCRDHRDRYAVLEEQAGWFLKDADYEEGNEDGL